MEHTQKIKPFSTLERFIAWRILRTKRRDGFVSLISIFSFVGITLGVATLIIVMAVMNGFRIELVNQILGVNGHINVIQYGQDIQNYTDITNKIKTIPSVKNVGGFIEQQIMFSTKHKNAGVVVRGHSLKEYQSGHLIRKKIISGNLDSFTKNHIAIGTRLASKFGLTVGKKVTLISPRGRTTPFGTAPRIQSFTVGAIFNLGMSLYDENFVFMSLKTAQNFFLKEGKVTALDIHLDTPQGTDIVQESLRKILPPNFLITTWQESNSTYLSALAIERNVMFIILSLIILVAALNIISSMIMLVKDKTKNIAILRTMGAEKNSILRIFFMVGALIGVSGTMIGLCIGTLFCLNIEAIRQFISSLLGVSLFDPNIYFLARMPAEMTATDVISVMVMALSLTLLAVLYPAKRAAKLDPARILRHE